jgi:uncharacterized protein YfiM (DUF2279 family)
MKRYSFLLLLFLFISELRSQDTIATKLHFFEEAKQYDKKRFGYALGFASAAYVSFSYGFYNSWYAKYPQSKFHLFNDYGEWNQMDKAGHVFSGYFQSMFIYNGAKWAGASEKKSIMYGLFASTLFQSTIEVMDGFSDEWGFSIGDVTANVVGLSTFYVQQKAWKDQRITLKESSWPRTYPNTKILSTNGVNTTTEKARALDLYGSSWGERALKDYNVQAYWASVNVKSFFPESKWPSWCNIAVGYGADNLYGGFNNVWTDRQATFDYSNKKRQRQFYLALDYDLRKIKTKSHTLNTILKTLNIYKFPAPAIEYNSVEGFKFHLMLY